jgi:hypothetical protein
VSYLRLGMRAIVIERADLWGKANVGAMMHELDCGCGCHLEGKDEQCLIVKVLLHLEAAHPEIEEPTIELSEEMVAIKAYETSISYDAAQGRLSFPY